MLEFLKNWIISVVLTVIFMVLIEMILPSNNFKKYVKFVTGLIIIVTIMTPIFKLCNKNTNIETYIEAYEREFDMETGKFDNEKIEERINKQTIEIFKSNLKKSIEEEIENETSKKYSVDYIEINEYVNSKDFGAIKFIRIKKKEESLIKPVEKVELKNENTKLKDGLKEDLRDKEVLNLLKTKFKIDSSLVEFVK